LVVDLAEGLDVTSEHVVQRVGAGPVVDGEPAAAVVLAMPGPQAARLLEPGTPAARQASSEAWTASMAVVLGWSDRRWPADLHGAFVHDSPAVDWVADDGDRRGDGAAVLVAHTTAELAARHLDQPDGVVPEVVAAVQGALGIDADPEWTHAHRWTFARPAEPREEPFLLADGIGLCGDGWSAPAKVESAWTSGAELGAALAS
jgi:predicted NAD/FAD-dependent oxidoreductase